MIHLEAIDKTNFYEVLELKRPDNEPYVAPNSVSLAEAWLYRDEGTVKPRAVYEEQRLVGFAMTHDSARSRTRDIWRILLPEEETNKGYGSQLLRILIDEARLDGRFDQVELSVVPGNELAEHVYEKCGFKATGEVDPDGEVIMSYRL